MKSKIVLFIVITLVIILFFAYTSILNPFQEQYLPETPSYDEAVKIIESFQLRDDYEIILALNTLSQEGDMDISLLPILNELIINSEHPDIRWISMGIIQEIGTPAQSSIPLLIEACFNDPSVTVQEESAIAISSIVHEDTDDVFIPKLILGLEKHKSDIVRASFAIAVGKYRNNARSYVPRLISILEQETDRDIRGNLAYAIQVISKENFSNYPNEPYWDQGFKIDSNTGDLLIVIAAKKWWSNTGRFIDWEEKTNN